MRCVKPVLFALLLSLLMVPARPTIPNTGAFIGTEREPEAPLGASAALVQVVDQGSRPRALVRLDLISESTDTDITVTETGNARSDPPAKGHASLVKGQPRSLFLESDLQAGRENHLFYRVTGRGRDGSTLGTDLYLRVNLDPALEPTVVSGALEFQGAQETAVPR